MENPLENLRDDQFEYIARVLAETDDASKQVITYTIIQHQSKILSFRRGLYNRAANFLRGAHCVGFGGHVNEADRDLFPDMIWASVRTQPEKFRRSFFCRTGGPRLIRLPCSVDFH
ncbi:hypothetical protein [Mesorhizobium sp. AR07]|uniref:hypothetical protein n=1 Tax=Mesorhizobium sp. AR07 TaxID=2865838 RepID=UPI00215E57AE|nr:hypothetical protein [Mesorhizobium sp. AR07]